MRGGRWAGITKIYKIAVGKEKKWENICLKSPNVVKRKM